MKLQLFNTFSRITERKDFNKLSDKELDELKTELIESLNKYKNDILKNLKYDFEKNRVEFREGFKNIDVNAIISELNKEFGEDTIRELNVEALLRKIAQIVALKKKSTEKRIEDEFTTYINTLNDRIKRQQDTFSDDEHFDKIEGEWSILPRRKYEGEKYDLQVELLKLQEWVAKNNKRVAIVFEGRDASGKGSTIKRFVEYLNPKHFRIVALGIPTEEEKNNWFERYEKQLPKPGEITFFDRSWYNRAVVEPAMGYCTEEQYRYFMENVNEWEKHLIEDKDIILIKLWFSITKEKQQLRFKLRQESPLKYWKFSPNDAKMIHMWDIISKYKEQMFIKTSTEFSPWVIINSNDKKVGRLNAIRYILYNIPYDGKDETKCVWYPEVVTVIE